MKSEIRSGTLLNYANLLLRIGVDFFMVPLLLLSLGKSEFAIYTLAGVVVARLALCDFGLTASATRFLSEYRARGDVAGEAHFLGNLLALFSLGGLVVLVLGLVFYPFLGDVFSRFTPGEMKIFRVLYLMTLLNTALMFPARSLGGISAAQQRFRVPGVITAVASALNIAGTFALLLLGFRSVALTALTIGTGVFSLLCHAIYCFGVLRARVSWNGWDVPLLRSLFAFSLWVFLSQLINVMNAGTGNFLVALTQNTEQVTLYTNSLKVYGYYFLSAGCLTGLYLPRVVQLVVAGATPEEQTDAMIRVGRYLVVLLVGPLFVALFFGREFFSLWIGDSLGSATDTCWLIAVLLMLPQTLSLVQGVGWHISQARNCLRRRVLIAALNSGLFLLGGYAACRWFGIVGLAAWGIFTMITQLLMLNFLHYKMELGLQIGRFYRSIFSRCWLWLPLLGGLAYAVHVALPLGSWWFWAARVLVFMSAYAAVMWWGYMSRQERERVF